MEEKHSKGISLRKKRSVRPPISAPKQISGPVPTQGLSSRVPAASKPAANAPQPRPQAGGKTSDFVKRRYSTRYNLPSDFDAAAPPLPSIPPIPGQYGSNLGAGQQAARGASPSARQGVSVDIKALRDPSLQPEKCRGPPLSSFQEMAD
ncbi:MAG: hypothetical protein M4579_005462 [Chaenotheca gracillima]|nr:MAG: hypothetical protein M4579_005462 [Chaenotheca gracillima]